LVFGVISTFCAFPTKNVEPEIVAQSRLDPKDSIQADLSPETKQLSFIVTFSLSKLSNKNVVENHKCVFL
jgi:hypothetical protein